MDFGEIMKTRTGSWLGLVLLMATLGVHAQSTDGVEPYEEYGKHLRSAQEVSPLTSDLFGDQVSLYNGATEFDVADIDLPGNSSLPVRFGRRLTIDDRRRPTGRLGGLGDWDLDVPYINGVFTQQNGWVVLGSDYQTASTARCSITHPVYTTVGSEVPPVASVWDGNQLHIPGAGSEELLRNTEAKLPAITDGQTYPWITKNYDLARCLSSTANGYPGEAFSVLTPSGVTYTFNWALINPTSTLLYSGVATNGASYNANVTRSRIYLLATRVQDRFGNWVTYTYNSSSQLTKILANDGREIDITWSGDHVTSAAAGTRTWTYGYAGDGSLISVTRPDGSQWKYAVVSGSLATVTNHDHSPPPSAHCQLAPDPNTGNVVYAMDSPSGAHGVFTFQYQRHWRTYVPKSCVPYNEYTAYAEIYDFFDNFTLQSKQISGAGLSTQNWTYDYGSNNGGYFTPTIPASVNEGEDYMPPGDCSTCAVSKVVTVTSPGDISKYTFGVEYARNEGRLLQTETDALDGTTFRTVSNTYLDDSQIGAQAFPDNAGISVQSIAKNPMVGRIRPVVTIATVQDNNTYTRQNQAFDAFANPTLVTRSNDIAGQTPITEQTTYFNDLSRWVLSLPQDVTNTGTGEVESSNTYDSSDDTLLSRARFGQTLMHYTYNSAGQLASFTDGDSNTTSLSNYYRGIPRLINYPDSTSQSATVSDYGEITSVTDQLGHTTNYQYDAVGWPVEIDYPGGDEAAWYPRKFAFAYVASAERGIAGGHWRRTVSTGNNVSVTYFDAMLRPLLSDTYINGTAGSDITTASAFDWRGLATFSSYPVSGTPDLAAITSGTHTTYDVLQRPTQTAQDSEQGTLLTKTQYLSGARVQLTDPGNNVTTTTYQVFDQPSTHAVIQVQAPEGVTQTIARDVYGNLTAITQSGLYGTETDSVAKQFYYDSFHRLCRTTEPESGSTITTYDNANNVHSTVSGLAISGDGCGSAQASALTTFSYDPMNRVTSILPPAGTQSTSYHYTPAGNVDQANSGTSLWSAHYNYRGMMTDETLTPATGQNPLMLGYAHNAYGDLDHVVYPDSESVSYAPDARGRPTKVGSYVHGVEYFPNGQVAGYTYADGTSYVAEQNARQLLKNFTYGNGTNLTLSEDLSYDHNGNILSVQDLVDGKRSKTFGYDGLNRLVSAVAPQLWGTESYSYDPLNNLRTRLTAGQTNVYAYDPSNRLTSIVRAGVTIASFGYDNRGNETSRNGNALLFDLKNQLTHIPGFDSYQYDAAGRRTVKTPDNGGGSTYSFYSHAGQLLYQYEPGISKSTNFIYLGSHLVADKEHLQLSAPGAVSFDANPNNGNYTVSWGAVTGASSYLLQEQPSNGSWTTVYSGAAASKALSARVGGSYVYQIKACNGSACGPWTLSATLGVRPTLPVVTVPSGTVNGGYTVSWTAPASASAYQVQERVDGGAWTTIASSTPSTSISRPGTSSGSYTYRVAASNSYGTRGWATSGAVTVDTTYGVLPGAPTSLSVPATSNNGSATLSWAATTLTTSYTLQQSGNGGTNWANAYQGTATSTTVSGLPDGSYSYRVQSCNTYGCSPWQAGSGTLVVTHPPAVAPALNATPDSSNGSYTVTWNGVSGALTYQLQEQVNGGSWTTVQNSAATQWSASGRGTGTYGHRVQACNVGGCGPWSATDSLSVLLPPPVPASVSVPPTSNGPVTVNWSASATATSYTLQHANNGVTGWSTLYSGGATSYSGSETTTGSWIYQVQACNASGCSAFRVSSGVTVTIPPASAPSLSVPTSSANGSYTVTWSAINGASAYVLQEQVNGGGWNTAQNSGATSDAFSGKSTGYYGYRAQGCNAGGCGPWSAVGTIAVAQPPAPPSSVTAPSYVHGTAYTVSWSASSGSTSYNVRRTNTDTGGSAVIASTAATNVGIAAPTSSQTLQYAVQACNANGCSGFTNAPNTTYTDRKGTPQIVNPVPLQLGGTP